VVGKQTVNTTLAMGHQGRPGALLKISNFHMASSTPNKHRVITFLTGEDDTTGLIPGDTIIRFLSVFDFVLEFADLFKFFSIRQ
jgi:hypothetical protein